MIHHIDKETLFEWIVPESTGAVCHLCVDGNYVGSIARDVGNPSARLQWSWRVSMPDSVDRKTPLAGRAMDEHSAKKAAEEAYSRATQEMRPTEH
jgi:hypothetical protein